MDLLKRFRYLILIIFVIGAFIVGTGLFFLGNKYALDHLSFREITPTQAANAMKDDHFWSSYRENTLIITGEISSITKTDKTTIVGFKTDSSYSAACSFTNLHSTITKGQTIKIITIAETAEREASGVMLKNCQLQS